jgi:RNA polymerase sigma-70 factor (ECF subfamily)
MSKINDLSERHDIELVELLIGGSQEAFVELYARFRKRLMFFCKQYMRNDADAEDTVHDIFLQLWEKRHFLGEVSSFSGYLKSMAKNHIMKKFRHLDVHSRFAKYMLLNEIDSTNETESAIIDNDYSKLLDEFIENLPPKQKEVFRLSRINGLTYKKISELLHISIDTVQEHASLTLKKMKKHLRQHTDIYY